MASKKSYKRRTKHRTNKIKATRRNKWKIGGVKTRSKQYGVSSDIVRRKRNRELNSLEPNLWSNRPADEIKKRKSQTGAMTGPPAPLGIRLTPFTQTRAAVGMQLLNPAQRQSNVLKKICNVDTKGACLDFGAYREQIKTFFNDYLLSPYGQFIRRIGQPSSNGFILQVSYEREGYRAYSAIKCNKPQRDNLLYEYFVGVNYINDFVPIFPCFVETYKQLYFFDNASDYNFASNIANSNLTLTEALRRRFREETNVKDIINPLATFANNACKFGKENSVAIMLQHYDSFVSIDAFGKLMTNTNDMPNVLLQIYFVLNVLKNEYTHYDLHAGNAFLYKPYLGERYIEMNYHFNDGTIIKFPTEYIAKIIDYGRNFFHNTKTDVKSQDLFDKFCYNCEAPECVPKGLQPNGLFRYGCGPGSGIYTGEYGLAPGSMHYIMPNRRNVSHDLRLITTSPMLRVALNDLNIRPTYPNFAVNYSLQYGTPEVKDVTFTTNHRIRNVTDMVLFLKEKVPLWNADKFAGWANNTPSSTPAFNKYGSSWTKMGEMHIYEDRRPYEFIASVI